MCLNLLMIKKYLDYTIIVKLNINSFLRFVFVNNGKLLEKVIVRVVYLVYNVNIKIE